MVLQPWVSSFSWGSSCVSCVLSLTVGTIKNHDHLAKLWSSDILNVPENNIEIWEGQWGLIHVTQMTLRGGGQIPKRLLK